MQFVQFYAARADTGAVLPYARATVLLTGTSTPAALFDANGAAIDNPLTADAVGALGFAANDGIYDLEIVSAGGDYSAPTIQKLQIVDLSGIVGTITSGRRGAPTYAAAEAMSFASGELVEVPTTDTDNHLDPITGLTVPNTGVFRYKTGSPSGLERIYSVDNGAREAAAQSQISAEQAAASAAAAAALLAAAPIFLPYPRTLTADDNRRTIFLGFPGLSENALASVVVPSHSVTPLAVGTRFDFVRVGTALIDFVSDAAGDAQITGYGGDVLSGVGGECSLVNFGPDDWRLFGPGIIPRPAEAFSLPVWIDPSDLSTMRQELTGASATTPVAVGDPVGSIRNKGAKGGWAVALANGFRPILRQTGALYYLEFDGTDDFMELDGLALNLAQLNVFCGMRVLTDTFGDGVLTFQSATSSDVNRNDGGFLAINGAGELAWRMGSPVLVPSIPGIIWKTPHVVELRKPGNAGVATTHVDNAPGNTSTTVTTLGTMARKLFIAARQANDADGAGQFGHVEFYSIAITDEILTDAQRTAIRTHAYGKSRLPQPQYPAITNLTQRNAARATLVAQVYSGLGIPTDVATLASETASTVGFGSVTGLASFQKATIPGYTLRPRMLTPASGLRNDLTVFIWIGHSTGISTYNVPLIAQLLINMGIRVIVLPLPDSATNDYTAGSPGEHETNQTPLKSWAGPPSIMMNTLRATYPTMKFYMAGISGGGWATQFCAAVDDRILGSTQFVGSLPEFIYIPRDWEQRNPGITAGFLEKYLLAASNGWHNHVLYENDPVGFNRAAYNSQGIDWQTTLGAMAAALGGDYDLSWVDWNQHNFQADSFTAQFINRLPVAP